MSRLEQMLAAFAAREAAEQRGDQEAEEAAQDEINCLRMDLIDDLVETLTAAEADFDGASTVADLVQTLQELASQALANGEEQDVLGWIEYRLGNERAELYGFHQLGRDWGKINDAVDIPIRGEEPKA